MTPRWRRGCGRAANAMRCLVAVEGLGGSNQGKVNAAHSGEGLRCRWVLRRRFGTALGWCIYLCRRFATLGRPSP